MKIGTIQLMSLTFMLFLFNSQNGISQQRKDYKLSDYVAKKSKSEIGTLRSTQEEVFFPTFGDECTFDLVTVGIRNQWGRVSGMNGLGDREKAQLLTFEGSEAYRVVGAMVWFERPAIVGDGTLIAEYIHKTQRMVVPIA